MKQVYHDETNPQGFFDATEETDGDTHVLNFIDRRHPPPVKRSTTKDAIHKLNQHSL